jgi:hypothetical protein
MNMRVEAEAPAATNRPVAEEAVSPASRTVKPVDSEVEPAAEMAAVSNRVPALFHAVALQPARMPPS